MSKQPTIPMSPTQLPQQRVYEVVDLPKRPKSFDCRVGYGCSPRDGLPKTGLDHAAYLCQVEWAWSPMHSRLDAYYLHRGRSEWSLWSKFWDDDWDRWEHIGIGTVGRRGVSQTQAGVYLLIAFWRQEITDSSLDQFHWINEAVELSVAQLGAMAREIWGDDE